MAEGDGGVEWEVVGGGGGGYLAIGSHMPEVS